MPFGVPPRTYLIIAIVFLLAFGFRILRYWWRSRTRRRHSEKRP